MEPKDNETRNLDTAAGLSEPFLSLTIRRQDGCHLSTMKDPLRPKAVLRPETDPALLQLGPGGEYVRDWPAPKEKT